MSSNEELAAIGRALVDIVDDVVAVIQDEKVVFSNQAAARIAGVAAEELIGSNFVDFLLGEDRAGHLESAREMLAQGAGTSLTESTVVARNGSTHRLEASTTTITFRGRPAFLIIARDITMRKAAEDQLKDSEERYRFLFQNIADGLLVQEVNPDGSPGRYVEANQAVCETLGYTRKELLELDLTDFATPELLARLPEIGRSLYQTGHAHFEAEYFSKSGQRIPCEIFLHSLELGGKLYVLSNARDLRDKIRAESDLHKSEKRYRMVLDSASDAITVHELEKDGLPVPGRFVEVNSTACQETGYTREELLNLTPMDITRVEVDELPRLREEILQNNRSTFEATLIDRNGRESEVEISAHLFNLSGTPLVVSVARNISDRKRVEAELRRAKEEAEKANQAKTTFLANVSHELRTPLGGVLGMTEMLLDRNLEPDLIDTISKIRSSAEDLRALIDDLLDLSVIEASRLHIRNAPFELASCIENATTLIAERFQEKGLSLDVRLDPRLPPTVTSDRTRIRQLLNNLLDNALKFTNDGGVAVDVKLLGSDDGTATIRFVVEDTGIGVPQEEQGAVFEKFVRLDNPINQAHGGTGLGLAICRQLVEQMGGELGVSPRPEGGSRFWFSLKLPVGEASQNSAPADGDLEQLKVLVVEDNEIGRELAVTMLRKLGCIPQAVENGRQALDMYRSQDFQVILMDLRMPDMDGLAATAAIRSAAGAPGPQPAIIAMTAQSLEENRESCKAAGMNGFLCKPFTLDDLRSVILRCVRST